MRDRAVPQPICEQYSHEKRCDVVHHYGDYHFVLPPVYLEHAGYHRPKAACHGAGYKAYYYGGQPGKAALGGYHGAHHGAHYKLALAAQVEHAALIGKAGAEAGEYQRGGAGERGAYVPYAAEGALPESLQRHGRVRAQRRHYYAAYEKGQYYGYYGNQQAYHLGVFHAVLLTCLPWQGLSPVWEGSCPGIHPLPAPRT